MKVIKKQEGMSTLNLILIIGLVGFFLTCFFKIGPIYLDDQTLKAALKSMEQERELGDATSKQIKSALGKKFQVNSIRDVNIDEDIDISKTKDGILIEMDYEKRVNLFGNLDVVVWFEHSYTITP